MEIYIYFTDPKTKYFQTAKTSALSEISYIAKRRCSKNTSKKNKSA